MNVWGIDIGGTKCALARLTVDGRAEEVSRFATMSCAKTLERFQLELEHFCPGENPLFGISCGGPLDAANGLILSPPNLPGWDRVPICKEIAGRFGGRVVLMNDANACALAEWRFGAGRGTQNMIFLTCGTGMGGGLILNGRLYEGASGDAGEVGHLRLDKTGPIGFGKAGSFEGFCSGGGIARLALMRLPKNSPAPAWISPDEALSAKKVAEAADAGEPFAREIMEEAGSRLGQALALLIDILNPERIVIGGIFPRCQHLLRPAMQTALEEDALPDSLAACQVVPAALGEQIGSYGAIAAALSSQS